MHPSKDQGHLWLQMGLLFVLQLSGVLVAHSSPVLLSQGSSRLLRVDVTFMSWLTRTRIAVETVWQLSLVTLDWVPIRFRRGSINFALTHFKGAYCVSVPSSWLRLSPELTLWFLVAVAILTFVIVVLSRLVNPLYSSLRKKTDPSSGGASRYKGCVWFIAFGQEKRGVRISSSTKSIQYQMKTGCRVQSSDPLTYLIVNGTLLVIIWNETYFYSGRPGSSQGRFALIDYLLQILVELIKKLAMLVNSLSPVLYIS